MLFMLALLTAPTALADEARAHQFLERQGMEHAFLDADGFYVARRRGARCTGTIHVTDSTLEHVSTCSTPAVAECDPRHPATCVDQALHEPARAPALLATACVYGRSSACGGWRNLPESMLIHYRGLWPIGCARGSVPACTSQAYVAFLEGRYDEAATLGERACAMGERFACEVEAVAHFKAGRKDQAVALLRRACSETPDLPVCDALPEGT